VLELGFVGCRAWYAFYETMVELDVPATIHVSASCNPAFHATGAYYINADTTAFMQFIERPFSRFPGAPVHHPP
jgi:4-oxalmesaconate hydratase